MATYAEFLVRYPEFRTIEQSRVEAALADAELVTADTWTEKLRPVVIMLTAADALAVSPAGRNSRLNGTAETSTYRERLDVLRRAHGCMHLRTGSPWVRL